MYVYASDPVFMNYYSGVVTDNGCTNHTINHAVLGVGFGIDGDTGLEYILLKNSWGDFWGANGYIKIGTQSSSVNGVCGTLYYQNWRPYF